MKVINVTVRNKIAKNRHEYDGEYICGNSDFVIVFDFDEEWNEFNSKTARFKYNGQYHDVVFTGNQVNVPIIENTHTVEVGVFAGNLHTTTPAIFTAKKSILCGSGLPSDPVPDVYAQIMEKIDSGMLKGEKGEPGYTPQKGVDYFDGQAGQPGKDGSPGKDGRDGYTPVRGTDYWTEADKTEIKSYVDEQQADLKNQLEYDAEKWGEVYGSQKQGIDLKKDYVWRLGWINGTTGAMSGDSAIDGGGDINWTHSDYIKTFEGAVFNLSGMYSGQSVVGGLTFYDDSKAILSAYTKPLGGSSINYTVPTGSGIKYVRVCTSYQSAEKWANVSIIGGILGCISTPKENIDNLYKKVNTYASQNEKGAVRMWTHTVGTVTTLYIATEDEV